MARLWPQAAATSIIELVGVHNEVQIWNPQTGLWTTGDDAAVARLYHSTTILLPDATVLSLGGGAPGPLTNTNGEIYKPSYLFNADGSLATRPVITDAPQSIEQQQHFTITVDDAASITRLTFIKTGSVTHSLDMSTEMLDLNFTHGPGNTLIVTIPNNGNVLAPGNWMLFAFNDHGTPSVAATISVGLGGERLFDRHQGYVTESGAATYNAASDVFTLTPTAASKTGAVWSNDRIDLTQNFTLTFSAFLGSKDAGGSGIAFVLQNDPWGSDAFGSGANSQGAHGIANGLAISLDTFKDSGESESDHTNFFDTDAAPGNTSVQGDIPVEPRKLEVAQCDGVLGCRPQKLTYWVDGKLGGTITGDLAAQYFGGSDYVHFGFTGATGTGTASNLQQVKVTSVNATYAPADAPINIHISQVDGTAHTNGNAGFDVDRQVFTLTPDRRFEDGRRDGQHQGRSALRFRYFIQLLPRIQRRRIGRSDLCSPKRSGWDGRDRQRRRRTWRERHREWARHRLQFATWCRQRRIWSIQMLDRSLRRLHPRFLSVTSKMDVGTKATSSGTPTLDS